MTEPYQGFRERPVSGQAALAKGSSSPKTIKPRILIFSRRPFTRIGVQTSLRRHCCVVESGPLDEKQLIETIRSAPTNCLILDVDQTRKAGVLVRKLLKAGSLKIIALIRPEHWDAVQTLLRAGVRGYLFDSCTPEALIRAIDVVHDG